MSSTFHADIVEQTAKVGRTLDQQLAAFLDNVLKPVRLNKQFTITAIPYTPPTLIIEIFSSIPLISSRSLHTKICVFYTVEIAIYLSGLGFDDITLVTEEYDEKMHNGAATYGYKYVLMHTITKTMKFDVIVGNPPYQEGDTGTNKMLFDKFWYKALDLCTGCIVLIAPTTWLTSNKKSLVNLRQTLHTHGLVKVELLDAQKVFGVNVDSLGITYATVGSTTSTYDIQLLDNSIITHDTDGSVALLTSNATALSIVTKVEKLASAKLTPYNSNLRSVGNDGTCGNNEASLHQTHTHPNKMINKVAGGTIEYAYTSSTKNAHQGMYRVAFSQLSSKTSLGTITILTDLDSTTSRAVVYIPTRDYQTALNVKRYLESSVFRFILSLRRTNTLNAVGMLAQLPAVDFTHSWTDRELYDEFELDITERKLIDPKYVH